MFSQNSLYREFAGPWDGYLRSLKHQFPGITEIKMVSFSVGPSGVPVVELKLLAGNETLSLSSVTGNSKAEVIYNLCARGKR